MTVVRRHEDALAGAPGQIHDSIRRRSWWFPLEQAMVERRNRRWRGVRRSGGDRDGIRSVHFGSLKCGRLDERLMRIEDDLGRPKRRNV